MMMIMCSYYILTACKIFHDVKRFFLCSFTAQPKKKKKSKPEPKALKYILYVQVCYYTVFLAFWYI